jgi:hypothetical protein
MRIAGNRKKKFVVIGQFDRKNTTEVFVVKAENHDVACHLAEIRNGWGTFMACDESQAMEIAKDIQKSLIN